MSVDKTRTVIFHTWSERGFGFSKQNGYV